MMKSYQQDNFKQNIDFALLKKLFPHDKLNNIEDYVDLFLSYRGTKYRNYLIDFCILCEERGFNLTTCQIEDIILDRLLNENYKNFKLKGQHVIDKMTGLEFEVFLVRFFKRCGYLVETTPRSHDKGTDLIIQLYGRKAVVQAKRRKQTIGIKAIQEVYAAKGYHGAYKALVIISSKFSTPAKEYAEKLDVELWDRTRLMQELSQYNYRF